MKVSIVMTSYNGARFIEKQMDSIRNQTYKADEVLIADDNSCDNTFQIVSSYIKNNKLNNWNAFQNSSNLGFALNFLNALKKASGDFVFFSDQDDIWELNKIEEMLNIIKQRDDILVLMSKENRINENDIYINYTWKETKNIRRIDFKKEIKECLGSGHLLVLKKTFIDLYIDKMITEKMTFDIPFCIIAAEKNGLFLYDRRLVNRRIHNSNTSGVKNRQIDRIKDYERYIQGRRFRLGYVEFILKYWNDIDDFGNKNIYIELNKASKLLKNSITGLEDFKLCPLLQELFSINQYLNKKISLANIFAVCIATFHRNKQNL